MSEWKKTFWGGVATLEYGKAVNYRGSNGTVPVYGTNGQIGFTDNQPLCNFSSVIIGRKGAYRGVHYSSVPFCVIDTAFYLKPINANSLDLKFSYYNLLTQNINRLDSGSAIPSTSREDFYRLELLLPPIDEQVKAVAVLSCLDRKISNLRQQNETLEKIAQTLFKHWFVDFEFPNEDGKPYRSSGGEMVRSEHLGEIPAGWKIGKSGDLIVLQGGFAFKSKDFKSFGEHGIIKIRNISGSVVDVNQTDFIPTLISQNIDKKFQINSGDVLIAMTGAEVAKVGVVPKTTKSLWLNQRVGLFREIVQGGKLFIYYLFTRETHQKILRDKGSGSSAQPNISATDIESIVLIRPSENILRLFNKISQPLFQKKCDNLQQIQTLTETRDRLLPKLMSGQLRIPQL